MFDLKIENYNAYRPKYPHSLIDYLVINNILKKDDVIAEFGCGTGKFTDLLLANGNLVYAVEPNKEMYSYLCDKYANVEKIFLFNKHAEDSFFPEKKFDLIISAQSFHLFIATEAKKEFYRILKPNGFVILIWYFFDMRFEISRKIRKLFYNYKDKLKQKDRLNIKRSIIEYLFYPHLVYNIEIDIMKQKYSKDFFLKSMLSSSYAPDINNVYYNSYIRDVNSLFDKYSHDGFLEYFFRLEIYYSKICFYND